LQALRSLVESVKSEFNAEELKDAEIVKAVKEMMDTQATAKQAYEGELPNVKKAIEAGAKFIAGAKK
jgi:hypothetical protein